MIVTNRDCVEEIRAFRGFAGYDALPMIFARPGRSLNGGQGLVKTLGAAIERDTSIPEFRGTLCGGRRSGFEPRDSFRGFRVRYPYREYTRFP